MKTALMVVMFVSAATLSAAQDRLAVQLRKGIVQEEARQDLTQAIKTYQAIVSQFDEERRAAATALYRLAECYRKTGKREQAVAAYQRVAREFADQAELAGPSRQQLASAYGIAEPRRAFEQALATAVARESTQQKALTNQYERSVVEEQIKAHQRSMLNAENDVKALEGRLKALQESVNAGTASKDGAEYQQLLRELEAAKHKLEMAYTPKTPSRSLGEPTREPMPALKERPMAASESPEAAQIAIQAMEAKLADSQKKVEVGLMSVPDYEQQRAEYEMLVQRYRQQVQERKMNEANAAEVQALNQKMITSVETEITLLSNWIASTEKRIQNGQYSPDNPELLQLRRELLGLQRRLEEMKAGVRR